MCIKFLEVEDLHIFVSRKIIVQRYYSSIFLQYNILDLIGHILFIISITTARNVNVNNFYNLF